MNTSIIPQSTTVISADVLDISVLSRQANILYFEIQKLESQKLLRSLAMGYLLSQAKAILPAGAWEKWVSEHCTFKRSMADEYRFLWEHRHDLFFALGIAAPEDQALIQHASCLDSPPIGKEMTELMMLNIPIRQALKTIRQTKRSTTQKRAEQQRYHRIEIVVTAVEQGELDQFVGRLQQEFNSSIAKISVRDVYRPCSRKRSHRSSN